MFVVLCRRIRFLERLCWTSPQHSVEMAVSSMPGRSGVRSICRFYFESRSCSWKTVFRFSVRRADFVWDRFVSGLVSLLRFWAFISALVAFRYPIYSSHFDLSVLPVSMLEVMHFHVCALS